MHIELIASECMDPANLILKLANISRPVVREEMLFDFGIEFKTGSPLFIEPIEEMLGNQGDVTSSLTERRQMDIDHIEPVEEVLTKAALLNFRGQIPVGCGDDPDIDMDQFLSTDAADDTFLNDPEQFLLQSRRGVADFIQKYRATVGQFKEAGAIFCSSRVGTFDTAEQFGFEKGLCNGPTVFTDEGTFSPWASVMD